MTIENSAMPMTEVAETEEQVGVLRHMAESTREALASLTLRDCLAFTFIASGAIDLRHQDEDPARFFKGVAKVVAGIGVGTAR